MTNPKLLKILFVGLVSMLSYSISIAQIFVDQNAKGNNDGSSWENAFINVQDGFNAADENDHVWVAAGTYFPGKAGAPDSVSFLLNKGIKFYGGFSGTEINLSERVPSEHPTILSGDLKQDDIPDDFITNRSDNVSTILLIKNKTNRPPLIDGIIFQNGHADGVLNEGHEPRGGGLFTYGPVELKNCQFRNNYAKLDGGGLFSWDSLFVSSSGNQNNADLVNSRLLIDSCLFENNYATRSGGGLSNVLLKQNVLGAKIRNSTFINNKTDKDGGAIENYIQVERAKVSIEKCLFENNQANVGGAIYNSNQASNLKVTFKECEFNNNLANKRGGGLFHRDANYPANNQTIIDACIFSANQVFPDNLSGIIGGGGLYIWTYGQANSMVIKKSTFNANTTSGWGGGLAAGTSVKNENDKIIIDSCYFENNESDTGGGIFYQSLGRKDSLFVRNVHFKGNLISERYSGFTTQGGGMRIDYSLSSHLGRFFVEACNFEQNNTKDGGGGGLAITPTGQNGYSYIHRSEFKGNTATGEGGGFLYSSTNQDYELEDCTFENNKAENGNPHLHVPQAFGKGLFYIFFHGVLWVQILYSFLLFLISRERSTIYYTLLMIGISLFFLLIIDFANIPLVNNIPLTMRVVLTQSAVTIIGITLVKFAQHYLNLNYYIPRAKKFILYLIIAFLIGQSIGFYRLNYTSPPFSFTWIDFVFNLTFITGIFAPVVWAIMVYRKGFQPAKYFLLAMLFTGAALALTLLYFIKDGNWLDAPIIVIQSLILLSVIALGLADGYRVNLLKKDKARAERLTELDIAKTRLYNNITHEFRTPLTVIMGSSEMIRGNEQEKKLIQRNSKRLLGLINQMLDLSKLEGGALKLEPKQGDIIPFIEYLVESFQSLAASKHIHLTFYRELEELTMDYDAEKMQVIISNLVSNAIKFTADSGKVVVHAKEENIKNKPHLVMAVRDNGQGITDKDMPHIFDRFFQVDASDIRQSEGSGIGLALVKELVDLMNGTIGVSSNAGKGTVFTIRIPITNTASIQTVTFSSIDAATIPEIIEEESDASFSTPGDKLPLALLIEDNKDVVSFLRSCLKNKYRLEVAFNGQQGINKALEIIPDIIISDVMMPEADGFTVCKTLKEDERTSHVPIIILTAKATQEDKVRGLDVGADAYLNKPFHREELEVRLEKLIELRKQLQTRFQRTSIGENHSSDKEDVFIEKLRSIIEDKMEDESFGITELCRTVGLSRMQVHRKLKALTGMTTSQFLHTLRLRKAYHLLQTTELNVSEVAYKVGFSDPSYFTKLFVKQFDKTPSEINK